MKRKFGLLALLILLLMAVVPSGTALASHPVPFSAVGVFETIDAGIVRPAGDSGRITVRLRTISGEMVDGDLSGPFAVVYGANVTTGQWGQLHGTMTVGEDYEATVQGDIRMLAGPVLAVLSVDPLVVVPAANLVIRGTWAFTDGAEGHGSYDGGSWFQVTPAGSVVGVLPAGLPLLNLDGTPFGISGPNEITFTGEWHNHD